MKPRRQAETFEKEYFDYVVKINRTAKVVKGGRRFSFSALVVAGNKAGLVGFGLGKANEVPLAVEKAYKKAVKNLQRIPLKGTSIPHKVVGHFGASKVLLLPASPGTGIIACAAVRAVLEALGIHDVLTKSFGSNNPANLVKAVMNGLLQLRSRQDIENLRGVNLVELDEKEKAYEIAVAEARARQEKLAQFQKEREEEKLRKQEEAKKRKEARTRQKTRGGRQLRRPPLRRRKEEADDKQQPQEKSTDQAKPAEDKPAETKPAEQAKPSTQEQPKTDEKPDKTE